MSVLVDQLTLGELKILVLDSAPNAGAGYAAEIGSLAIVQGTSGIYQKSNTVDTDWIISSVNAEDVQDIVGGMLTDSADLDFSYNDPANTATAVLTTTGVSAGTYGSATAVGSFTVDSKGRLSFAGDVSIAIPSTQVTDFTEAAQDAIGASLLDTATVDLTYDDALNQISADVVLGSLDNSHIAVAAAIDATKIGSGLVDNTEFGYLNGVTSAIQTQLNGKAATVHTHVSTDITDFTEAAQDAVLNILTDSATVDFTYNDAGNTITAAVIQSGIDHGSVSGLSDDDHGQYGLLAGRSGGQILNGDTASAGNLELHSTSNGTKGKILLGASIVADEANTRLGIGSATPDTILHVEQNNVKYNMSANSTTTSGAVNAVVGTVATASNSVELLKVFVTGLRTNGSNESVAYERTVRVKNKGGTLTLPTIQSDYTSEDGALSTANCTFIVNGASVDVRVTGVSACDITWKVIVQRMR
ncbi:MAG TPA: hypothetical protein PKI14_12770 [Fervidobacterium sp.]|nr:hypothetical protein [Fervidobacterium sp.]